MMKWTYSVRPADPLFRREHPGASEVIASADGRTQRVTGIWRSEEIAGQVASILTRFSGEQIR